MAKSKEEINAMREALKGGKPINDPMGAAREARREKVNAVIAEKALPKTEAKEVTLEDENKNRENLFKSEKIEPDETIELGDDDANDNIKRPDGDGSVQNEEEPQEENDEDDGENGEETPQTQEKDLKQQKKEFRKKRDDLGKNIGKNRELENEVLQKTQALLLQQLEEQRKLVKDQQEFQTSLRIEQVAKKYGEDSALADQAKVYLRNKRHEAQRANNFQLVDQIVEQENQLQVYTQQLSQQYKQELDQLQAQRQQTVQQQVQQPPAKKPLYTPERDVIAAEKLKAWVASKPWFKLENGQPQNAETWKAVQEMDKLHKSGIPGDHDIFYREIDSVLDFDKPEEKAPVADVAAPVSKKPVVTGGSEASSTGTVTQIPTKFNISDLKPAYQEMYRGLKKNAGEKEAIKFFKKNFSPAMLKQR